MLAEGELDPARISKVVGQADHEPLDTTDPTAAQNRRISIILLYQQPDESGNNAEGSGSAPPARPHIRPSPGALPR
jgi:hypothetical protein